MKNIKARKQGNSITVTIPAEFNVPAGTKFVVERINEGILYKFVNDNEFFDFDKNILKDLINQGYTGDDLIDKFIEMKKQIPETLNKLRKDAKKDATHEVAMTKEEAEREFDL